MDFRKQPILESLTPFSRLLFSILLIVSCFSIAFVLGLLLAVPLFGVGIKEILTSASDFENTVSLKLLQYFQVIQSFGLFIIPAMLAGYFFERSSIRYLRIDIPSWWPIYLITLILMLASLPLINWMVTVNDMMKLPDFLNGLEAWMKTMEEEAEKLTRAFMQMPTPGAFLFNMFMIALLPAIGEEFMFRGLIQRLFREWLGNIHVAIFLSALLFSAMHMQFYGFFPRMVLGIVFGYLFYWSGSIWIPVFAHFIQNGLVVMVTYLGENGIIYGDYENFGTSDNVYILLMSALFVAALLYLIYRWRSQSTNGVSGKT